MTDRDKLIEAICKAFDVSPFFAGVGLRKLEANGLVVVPREPTVKMVAAGFHEYVLRPSGTDGMELIDYCYRAMIAAAPMQGMGRTKGETE
jgi:hypothetical protein